MANNLRRASKSFGIVQSPILPPPKGMDDPSWVLEVLARAERNSRVAIRQGLPAIGSKLVNKFGLEFVVESHLHVPTANTVARWREGKGETVEDLYPSIIPLNLSPQLTNFIFAVERCSPKTLLIFDTMPHLKKQGVVGGGHWIDTISNPGSNLLFINAAHIHETHFAHEIGHAWVQYVELAEDERVMVEVTDPARLHQLSFIQSFVLDLRVNQVIQQKGFDISVILEDQAASIASLGRVIEAGYKPESKREEVFMAIAVANQILQESETGPNELARLDETLGLAKGSCPDLATLAIGLAEAVKTHGYGDRDSIRASIDECLRLAFEHTGDGLDLTKDLVIPTVPEPRFDKNPDWIQGASRSFQCEVGRVMAREDIPTESRWHLSCGQAKSCILSFTLPDESCRGPYTLEHPYPFAERDSQFQHINEINRQNRDKQMKNSINSGMPDFPGQPKRFYMPGLARFLTRVREVEWLGGEHPYGYAFDNPISYVDPTGMAPLLQPLPTMMCQDNPLDAPFTKAMCRALCFELADANKDGKIGPIERKRIYDPCLVACKRLGAKGERRLWCKGIESTIDHLLRHPKEGYMNIKNKQLLESLLALWNAMGCPGSPPEID